MLPKTIIAARNVSLRRYANANLQAWLKAMDDVLSTLKREGSLNSVRDRLASFEERQRVVQKEKLSGLNRFTPTDQRRPTNDKTMGRNHL